MTELAAQHSAHSIGPPYYGLYPARVTKIGGDPDRDRQRIEVAFEWCRNDDGNPTTGWATMTSPYADAGQGFQMLPEINSTVVVGFFAGHIDDPYVIGSMWNGQARAPDAFDNANNKRVIETRSGSRLEFDDTGTGTGDGTEPSVAIRLSAAGPPGDERHSIVLDHTKSSITIHSKSGPTITITPAGDVNIERATRVTVQASLVTIDAPVSKFTGVVVCQTLQAQVGVISPSYTPGAGNTW